METDIDLLRRLGDLRDATVEEVVWRKADRSLRMTIVAPVSAVVTFVGIEGLSVETALFRGVFRVSGIDVERRGNQLEARIGLGEPGSALRLLCNEIGVTIGNG